MLERLTSPAVLKRETTVRGRLPYARHATETVIALDGGALMAMVELEGASFETADAAAVDRLHDALSAAWRTIGAEDLALWQHLVRLPSAAPAGDTFTSAYAGELDEAWRAKLARDGLFSNRLYLAVVLKAPVLGSLFRRAGAIGDELQHRLSRLETVMRDLQRLLEPWRPRRLGVLAHGGGHASALLAVLASLLEGRERTAPIVRGHLGEALGSARLIFGREAVEIRHHGSSTYAAMLGLKAYPATTWPGAWDALLAAPFRLVISQSFAFLSRPAGEALLGRRQNQMVSAADRAASQIDQLDEAMDDLASGRFVMGEHQASVMVFADTPADLSRDLSMAGAMLAGGGLVVAREDVGLEAAFWAQFPGNFRLRTRPAAISSRNFAGLAPLHAYPEGRAEGLHWGQPLTTLRTRGRTRFDFSMHVNDLGHTFICGPSGSGKTVLQNFILAQAQRFAPRQVLIDKDRGAEIFVRACDGAYHTLRSGQATGLAPLKALEEKDAGFLRALVLRMALGPVEQATPQQIALLDEAVAAVLRLPRRSRSMSALRGLLGQQDAEGLGARLERWCDDGALAWALDGEDDALDLAPPLVGFDMTTILDDAEARAPVMMYLLHRIGALADGRRLIVSIDEFWKTLGDEAFRAFARDGLKTWRKQNAVLVLSTQSPSDVLASPIARTILEQCATHVFLPNGQAAALDYRDGFGLSEREFQLVRDELGVGGRGFLIRQAGASAVAELDLSGLDDHMAVLSGRAAAVAALDRLRAELGDAPTAWRSAFRQHTENKA
ncbi:VirB4 family type IV secretion/conjugal transfer ATPase [Caulobacter segnis]|uniref:VirB4 family type IV secretion/conjugal transfer ATPase n=1 Tax=Caulobacter segnis TaxID=88688 RepID=UPI00241079CE|nr:VirB4 family type IV secretion/conjugal transfer ATPase [Caulobacter segnis]MDG2520515.1 VirB4 family type IV secretion/conjugal transfer ATPase [Caulobacter segnis]